MSDKMKVGWFNEVTIEYFTPKVRFVYPVFLEPKINKKFPTNPPKFSGIALVPADANIDVLVKEVQRLAASLYGAEWKAKAADDPALAVKIPIKKTANYEKLAEYAKDFPLMLNVSANADFPPLVLGPDAKPISKDRAGEVYGGRWGIMALNVWGPKPENKNVNRFVSLGLQRVQMLDQDEPIATGRIGTAEGFEAIASTGAAKSGGNGSADDLF
jgi:hypothetical protein